MGGEGTDFLPTKFSRNSLSPALSLQPSAPPPSLPYPPLSTPIKPGQKYRGRTDRLTDRHTVSPSLLLLSSFAVT